MPKTYLILSRFAAHCFLSATLLEQNRLNSATESGAVHHFFGATLTALPKFSVDFDTFAGFPSNHVDGKKKFFFYYEHIRQVSRVAAFA